MKELHYDTRAPTEKILKGGEMVKHIGNNVAVVSDKELGTNCWSSFRFARGLRCPRVFQCNYPEKKTCRAVEAELTYLRVHPKQLIKEIKKNAKTSIKQLENDLKNRADVFCLSID